MNTEQLKQKVKKALLFWILFSIASVVALPCMIVSLVKGLWIFAVPCIVIVVGGFYGLPIGWVMWAKLNYQKKLVLAIVEDGITEIRDLAATFGRREKSMRKEVNDLFAKRYLPGYKFSPDGLKLITAKPTEAPKPVDTEKKKRSRCENCGAPLKPDEKVCSYCNCIIT